MKYQFQNKETDQIIESLKEVVVDSQKELPKKAMM